MITITQVIFLLLGYLTGAFLFGFLERSYEIHKEKKKFYKEKNQ